MLIASPYTSSIDDAQQMMQNVAFGKVEKKTEKTYDQLIESIANE